MTDSIAFFTARFDLDDDVDDEPDDDDDDFDDGEEEGDEEDDEDEETETWQVGAGPLPLKAGLSLTSGVELPRLTPIFQLS
jgi:hypothetical protein